MLKILCCLTAVGLLLSAAPVVHAGQSKKELEAEYLLFLKMLPGDYDNVTQAQSDSTGANVAVIISIRPLDLQLVGHLVLYVRETAADDPRRLLAQHIWTVERDKEQHIVQHVYQFKEPQRWVRAGDDPLLLQSLLPDDLQQMTGCEIYWTRSSTGFSGTTRPHVCRPAASEEGHLIEVTANVSADDMLLTEQQAGTGGRLPADGIDAYTYRLQRRGGGG
jgi:CpeT/CpcT family (DUF1001)